MRIRFVIRGFMALVLCLYAASAWAGVIELSVSVAPSLTKHGLRLDIRLANQGDEPARDIGLEAVLPGAGVAKAFPGPGILKPGAKRRTSFILKHREQAKGLHPVVVRVCYRDANQYPFSTLAYGLYQVGPPVRPVVLSRGIPSTVAESGRAAFALANLSPDPLAVEISFFAPGELSLSDASFKTRIAADGKEILETGLENRSALAGASYPVLALVRYEWRGQTVTAPASATVTIVPEREAPLGWWIWAGLLILFAGLALWLGTRRGVR